MIDTNGKVHQEVNVQHTIDNIECGLSCGAKLNGNNTCAVTTTTSSLTVSSSSSSSSCCKSKKVIRRVIIMSTFFAFIVACTASVYFFLGWQSLIHLLLVAIIVYVIVEKKYRWFYVALRTIPRDLKALFRYIPLVLQMKRFEKKDISLADVFRQNVVLHPNKECLVFEDQVWTFAQVEEYSNKIANVFKSHGYKKGDIVALFLENRPEYVCIWLGLSKLGVVVPLLNTNLRLVSLVHSIKVAKCQAVIFGSDLAPAISEILDNIESTVSLYQIKDKNLNSDGDSKFKDLDALLSEASSGVPVLKEKVSYHDHLLYIYTSGTTGLPKAAVITHCRFMFIACALHWLSAFKCEDRFYTPLPLYHTAGGVITVGQMLIYGSTVVIRKKFSATSYILDIKKYNCTVCQYIGEMCRYVLAVQPRAEDKQHNLRIAFGNGLRPQIWSEFKERFNIKQIGEFYGATEGNANIMNVDDTAGAIGFVSRIIPAIYPISIIKVDEITGEPIRNSKGLCIPCQPNEPGVFIGKIRPNDPSRAFLGYVDQHASKKKVVYDVFNKGDSAFISGDILVADELGYLFFKDRTGDTFRWKGENVSTSEVEAIVSNIVSYKDVVVYGIEIHGQEGRAGMAAILDADNTIDMKQLAVDAQKHLPTYARPIFIRILHKMDMTGTYKMKKLDLQKEGFNPDKITDHLYYLNNGVYSPLTKDSYEQIQSGKIRL